MHRIFDRPVLADNLDAATTLGLLLETAGHEVHIEHGSRTALTRYTTLSPDVCLLDIGLPDMDGYQLARTLRGQAGKHHAVMIAVTGYGWENDRIRSMDARFDHHLVKPIDIAALHAILARIDRVRV